jgi:hypothetical protein
MNEDETLRILKEVWDSAMERVKLILPLLPTKEQLN